MNQKISIAIVLALGVAFMAGTGACMAAAGRGARQGRRWQLGWSLIALSLACRLMGDATWLRLGFGTRAAPSTIGALAGYLLALQPVLLCAGLSFLAVRSGGKIAARRVMMGLDALIFSGSTVALLWWFWLEPLLMLSGVGSLARLGWVRPFAAGLNTLAVMLCALTMRASAKRTNAKNSASAITHPSNTTPAAAAASGMSNATSASNARAAMTQSSIRGVISFFLLFSGVALLAITDLRFFTAAPGQHLAAMDLAFLWSAPLLIGSTALWQLNETKTNASQTDETMAQSTSLPSISPPPASVSPQGTPPSSEPRKADGADAFRLAASQASGNGAISSNAISDSPAPASFMSTHAAPQAAVPTARSKARAEEPLDVTKSVVPESALSSLLEKTSALDTNPAESLFLLFLPCLVALVGAWHLGGDFVMPTAHPRLTPGALGEMWWGPMLVLLSALRHALAALQSTLQARGVRREASLLKDQVSLRTHQLSTLHAVAADLNNTLNRDQVLSTALERMMEAVHADAGAVWLRVDFIALAGQNDGAPRNGLAASLASGIDDARREGTSSRRHAERDNISNGATPEGATNHAGGRWHMVRASGTEVPARKQAIEAMNSALESGGLARCAQVCATQLEMFGSAHVAPIRWKGEVMGTLGVMRARGELEPAERALLESIALEVGAALQNAHLYQEATRRANLDGVTDLYNHRTIQEKLNQELANARTSGKPLTIVMMDLNNFKFFNDTYGHPVGDTVLRTVARCLRDVCRADDIMGRYGGDEFVAILPDTDAHGAYEVCSRIAARVEEEAFQENDGRRIPIGLSFGAAVYPHDGNAVLDLLTLADANLYEAKRGGAPVLIQRSDAEETQELRQLKDVGVGGSFGVLDALVTAIDNKDHYTRRHSEDVTHWATLMARELDYSVETQRAIRICGLLHDVGKIAVPDAILRKPGRLADDEFNIMQQHPVFGALIVKDVPNLTEVLGGIRHHHERFDGKGYPDKLIGEDIPMMGRLLSVPDCFSAMTTDRPYRKALSWSEALSEIERGRGTQFDPVMADAFLEVMARIVTENQARALGRDKTASAASSTDSADEQRAQAASVFGTPDEAATESDGEPIVRPRSVTDAATTIAS